MLEASFTLSEKSPIRGDGVRRTDRKGGEQRITARSWRGLRWPPAIWAGRAALPTPGPVQTNEAIDPDRGEENPRGELTVSSRERESRRRKGFFLLRADTAELGRIILLLGLMASKYGPSGNQACGPNNNISLFLHS